MNKYRVVLTDHVYPDLDYEKNKLSEINAELVLTKGTDEEHIIEAVKDADAIITCYANITRRVLEMAPKCKSVSKTGIGVNNIDVDAATALGIKVLNCPDYCIDEVSDHALALLLTIARRTAFLDKNVKGGMWSFENYKPMYRLTGLVLGVLGFGRIARRFVEKVKPLGFQILAYDPYVSEEVMQKMGVRKVSLEEALMVSDYISLHLPLTAETNGIINQKTLSMMKKTACVINTSRGPLIDEHALYDALLKKEIAYAALDVLCQEKYVITNPLFSLENIVVTPHVAFYSEESTEEMRQKVISDVISVLQGKEPKYQVNHVNN